MSWWKSNKYKENFIVEIDDYGEYEITPDEVEAFYTYHKLSCADPKENRDMGMQIARMVALDKLSKELKEQKFQLERSIDSIDRIFQTSLDKVKVKEPFEKPRNSYFDFDTYTEMKSKKMEGEELDAFMESFFGADNEFVDRIKEEDERARRRTGNSRESYDKTEQERMKENANFWGNNWNDYKKGPWGNSSSSTVSDWWKVLGFDTIGEVTKEKVKSNFRELAMKHHPDVGGDAEKFKEIVAAKEAAFSYLGA